MSTMAEPRRRVLVTPEGVDLRLRLGEAGPRASAFVLDLAFMVLTLAVFTIGVVVAASSLSVGDAFGFRGEALAVVWIVFFFLLRSFYFTAFEMGPRAATPGKRIMGLRVARRDGGPLRAENLIARNAMREVELFLPLSFVFAPTAGVDGWIALFGLVWSGVFVLFPLFNRDRLRAGDLIGGTWVVEAPKRLLADDLSEAAAAGAAYAFTTAELDAYGIKELHVLEDVLRAREEATVVAVAERIRAKLGRAGTPSEDDAAFLEAYYAALRGWLEDRLLFGERRADKHAR